MKNPLRELIAKATPGPWIEVGPSFGEPLPKYTTEIMQEDENEDGENYAICTFPVKEYDAENEANASLIVMLRNHAEAIADLIDETAAQHKDCKILRCWTCEILSKLTEGK